MKASGTVIFLLNGTLCSIDFHESTPYTPTTTVLQFLRSYPQLQGTKEGCAEGDCGACTVVIARLNRQSELVMEACDSCLIFLPMLHGKALITVEHIGTPEHLHPVQKAMVDHDGSQCGYCTPGFVMSLYALHHNHPESSRELAEDALTGNLCRCTGYRSILDAALQVHDQASMTLNDQKQTLQGLQSLQSYPLSIVSQHQKYFQPHDLQEAVKLRSMYPEAVMINGATDVALKVTKNDEVLEEIIDLSSVKPLKELKTTDQYIYLGAGLSLEQVKKNVEDLLPALYETLKVFGSLQIRNLATIGGNIASASPIGDTAPILMAYNAQVELVGPQSTRLVPMREFITGYRETSMQKDEIILGFNVPIPNTQTHVKWYKISKRKDLDISTVSGGFRLELEQDATVSHISLFYGGMAAMTKNASKTEASLVGRPWIREQVALSMDIIDQDFTPISDARAEAGGRRIMARNLLMKFWTDTHG